MAVALTTLVDALKREVQPPGADLFSDVTQSTWVGYLADAFWEVRLDGFLPNYATDGAGVATTVVPISGTTELPREMGALVVLYAGVKVLRNKILNTNTTFRAKAGPVEFEQQNSANLLVEMLKQLKATKDRVIENLDTAGGMTGAYVLDAFSARLYSPGLYFGDISLTG